MPDFEVVDIPRFKSARLVWTLEAGGAASAEIDIRPDDPDTVWTPPHRLLVTGPKDWGGEVTNFHRSGTPTEGVEFRATAVGHTARLDKRIVRHVYEVNDTLDVHVQALLSELQDNQFNGDMGFQFGNATGTFATKLKAYCFGLNAGDSMRELASMGHGFDWEIDAQGFLNMWGPTRGVDTGLTLDPEACHEVEIDFDSSDMVTTVTAFGDNSDPYGPKHTLVRNMTADDFGRRETVINTDIITLDEKNPNWLQDLEDAGRGVLKELGGAQITMKTTWLSNNAPWVLGAVWLNDSANVLLADYFGGTRAMRCTDVTVTLDPMPPRSNGTVAPIYFVEMGWDTLINDTDMIDGDPDGGDG